MSHHIRLPIALFLILAFAPAAVSAVPGPGAPPAATEAPAGSGGTILAVVGGLLIDGTGSDPIPDSAIIIEGGRIMAAGPRRQTRIPPGAVAVDATDRVVIPGLVDMHTHLVGGIRLEDYLRHGVTSVRHMGNTTLDWIHDLKEAIESGRMAGPRVFHCGRFVVSEPPLQSGHFPEGEIDLYSVIRKGEDIPRIIDELVGAGADLVKVKAHMDPAYMEDLCRAAGDAGLPVSFDAMGGDSIDALQAVKAGALGVEHLSGIDFESPEHAEKVLRAMLERGAFAVPTFSVLERTFGEGRIAPRRAFISSFSRRGGVVLAGSDAPTRGTPPGASLHEELEHLAEAGLDPMQVIVAATGAAGRALGYQGLVGTIETGAHADLVILRDSPLENVRNSRSIERVFKGGVQAWPGRGVRVR